MPLAGNFLVDGSASRSLFTGCIVAAVMLAAHPAIAQERESRTYGDIVVIARMNEESAQKAPVVQNVVTAKALKTLQIQDMQDLMTKIPGLVGGDAVLAIGEQVSLRGVGTNAPDQGVNQSVSLNIDGLVLTHGLAYRAAIFDLEQVEVLKGPQALFFGKNSTAGVIAFRSADPGSDVEVTARAGYEFETREMRGELVYSLPVSDTVGLRLAGLYGNSKGPIRNRATAQPGFGGRDPRYRRIGGGISWLFRPTLLWQPSPDVTVRLKANIVRDDYRQGGIFQLSSCPDGTGNPAPFPWSFFHPDEDCRYDKTVNIVDLDPAAFPGIGNNGTPFLDLEQDFGTLEINYWIAPHVTLKSISGYYEARAEAMLNAISSGYAGPNLAAENSFRRRETTQELRLNSQFPTLPINFSFGAFYQKGTISNLSTLRLNTTFGFPPLFRRGRSTVDFETFSEFGQVRWQVDERLEVAGGVRWTREVRHLDVFDLLRDMPVELAPGSNRIASANWSPEATVTFTPTDDVTIYAAFKQAYKSGSFNLAVPGSPGQDMSFGDEKVQGGEAGLKTRLLSRNLSLDIAGYYYRYLGLQVGVNEPLESGLISGRTLNAGKAEIYGIDFEARYQPSFATELNIHVAGAWNKTRFIELNDFPCFGGQLISQGCTELRSEATGLFTSQNLKGTPFVRAPEWVVNFGWDYTVPLGGGMRLVLANDYRYSSSYLTVLGNPDVRPDTVMSKALTISAGVAIHGKDDRWSVRLSGKNLTDKLRPGFGSGFNFAGGLVLAPTVSGGAVRNAAGEDEIGHSMAAGRAIAIQFGLQY